MVVAARNGFARKPTHLRRQEIADAAMRILALEGHRRFTTKYLAAKVGLTEGAIFRHFPTMAAIADAIIERMGEALLPSLAAGSVHPESAPIDRLRSFFQHRAAMFVEKPELARLLLSDHLAQAAGEEHAARVGEFRRKSQRFVLECLTEAKNRKLLATGVSVEAGTRLVMGALMAVGHGGAPATRTSGHAAGIEDLWYLVERALRAKEVPR